MSLYDKASLVFSGKAAAGKDGKAYNIKPVEKLKVDELVTNGDFSYDGDWTEGTGWSISNGKATKTAGTAANLHPSSDMNFDNNKHYRVTYTISGRTAGQIRVKLGNSGYGEYRSADGTYSEVIKPVVTTFDKLQFNTDSTFAGSIDNVSVREVEQKANDFTFTRGSNLTATLEGADGLIKKGRENLFTYSNDFRRNAQPAPPPWSHNGLQSFYGPQNNPQNVPSAGKSGYDGSGDASFFVASTADSRHEITLSQTVNGVQTISIYAKAGGYNFLFIRTQSANNEAFFNLSTGSVGTTASQVIDAKMEDIGSDWYRCSMTVNGSFTSIGFGAAAQDNVKSFTGDGSSGIYIMDAQREMGLVATPYIHTTDSYSKKTAGVLENEPRYDYSGGDATLLLEPLRTNLSNHSEYINEFSGSRTTVTHNYGTSPEGVVNSSRMVNTTDDGGHRLYSNHFDLTLNSDYTISVFAKKGSRKIISMELMGSNESDVGFDEPIFNLDDASISGDSSNAFMEDYGNGWYRCGVTSSATSASSTGQYRMYLYLRDDTSQKSYVGSTGDNVELYGMQVEKGSYATSYIPTYGSAATREGEGDSLSSFTCTLDKPLSKKYTIFMDLQVDNLERPTTNFDDIFVARASDGNNYAFRLEGYHDPTPDPDTYSLRVFAYSTKDSRAALSSDHSNGIQLGQRNKIAIVFDDTVGVKVFLNGNSTPLKEVLVGGSFSTFPTETLQANSFYDVKFLEGGSQPRSKTLLHGVQAYDVALSDAECVSLTTI